MVTVFSIQTNLLKTRVSIALKGSAFLYNSSVKTSDLTFSSRKSIEKLMSFLIVEFIRCTEQVIFGKKLLLGSSC